MAIDPEILKVIPSGCKVNWNGKVGRYYVYKSKYTYDPEKKRSREVRTQIGTVVDGKFHPAKRYQLQQKVKSLQESEALARAKAGETAKEGAAPVLDSARRLEDPRNQARITYRLDYVCLVALLASLSGLTSCVQISEYWASSRPALEKIFSDFPKADISHDTVRRLFMLIDPAKSSAFYKRLVYPLLREFQSRVVAVDGQAVRASKNESVPSGRYILSFYDTDNGVTLSQRLIGSKENEITHAASMISGLNLQGCVVTADALNTQRNFADSLVRAGADYCLAVKGNQKNLYYDTRLAFLDKAETRTKVLYENSGLAHGRIETRSVRVLPGTVLGKSHTNLWTGLEEGSLINARTESTDKKTGLNSCLDRFFISSLRWDNPRIAEQAMRAVRRHWAVENELHYVLDVDFLQDWAQCKNAQYLYNRVLLDKLGHALMNKIQALESAETGKEPASKRSLMTRFRDATFSLTQLARLFSADSHA